MIQEKKMPAAPPPFAPRYIVSIEPDGFEEAQCIRIAHPSRLYVTDDCIPTHNTYAGNEPVEDGASFRAAEKAYGGKAAFEKAKTDGKTKLNFRQWVQVRTPEFKNWFGDWEALHDLTIRQNSMSREDAAKELAKLSGQDLTNLETGIEAQINARQAGKLVSQAAITKSEENGFSKEQHFAVAAKIENLWKHAMLVEAHKDQNSDPNILSVKRFAAPFVLNGETGYAYLTAKESTEHGHRVYSVELQELKTLRSTLDKSAIHEEPQLAPVRSVESIIGKLNEKLNPDSVSKATDPQTGEPLAEAAEKWADSKGVFFQSPPPRKEAAHTRPGNPDDALGLNAPTPRQAPPKESIARNIQRTLQDRFNRFTVIKEWLRDKGVTLSEAADVYKAEERMHGRFTTRAQDFSEEVRKMVVRAQRAGVTMAQVGEFLHAQHAEERNRQVAKINPAFPDGGSGMSNAEAAEVLAKASPALKKVADEFRAITDGTLIVIPINKASQV